MKLGTEVPEATIHMLEKRAEKLASLVDLATRQSSKKDVREGGTLLIERLGEWVDDIKALREVGDEDIHDVIQTFWVRLHLAERKTRDWSIPDELRTAAGRPKVRRAKASRPQRRRLRTAA
ncbi:MAG: hypothetical protein H6729_07580 [Deltaproteobacteria bacterium]|nr:hypothetical protein [Deltaproteobacteria bacterium]